MKVFKVGFFSSLILVLLIEISLLIQALFYSQPKAITTNSVQANVPDRLAENTNNSFTVPPLFPQLEFTSVLLKDNNSLQNTLKSSMLYRNTEPTTTSFTGKEWVASQKNLLSQDVGGIYKKFSNYYETELIKNGWSQEVKYKNLKLQTLSAGGATGSTWGYLKIINDKIEIILLSDTINSKGNNTEPPQCPCNVVYRVFVSDAIPTSEITK